MTETTLKDAGIRLLAISSSRVKNSQYLETAVPVIGEFLDGGPKNVAFVPFAAADRDYATYTGRVADALSALGYSFRTVTEMDGKEVLADADVIMVGGGNTFKLLHDLYQYDLLELIRTSVLGGIPYIGWSAGSNLTGPSICTTNDMPVLEPYSFKSLGFLPFQINPHYYNVQPEGFHGETRDQRISEFVMLNPAVQVVGIPEGTALRRENDQLNLLGGDAVLFKMEDGLVNRSALSREADLTFLLQGT